MLRQIRLLDREIAGHEQRIESLHRELQYQSRRTGSAFHERIAQPDALMVSAGLGALYGLWTSRPTRSGETTAGGSVPRGVIPGWLVRSIVSTLASRWLAPASEEDLSPVDTPAVDPTATDLPDPPA